MTLQVPTVPGSHQKEMGVFEPYFDRAGRVARLASTDSVTFRLPFSREPENFDHAEYEAALSSHSTVRDCLTERERSQDQPDLTRFDWVNMTNHGVAYACLILVFTSYSTAADVLWWMAAQRMFVKRSYSKFVIKDTINDGTQLNRSENYGILVGGGFDELPYGDPENSWPLSTFESKGYGISAGFSKSHGLVSLDIVAHRRK